MKLWNVCYRYRGLVRVHRDTPPMPKYEAVKAASELNRDSDIAEVWLEEA